MKITLYMATTIDSFIAKSDGDSDWVSPVDTDNFMSEINKKGCIIVGNRTYQQFLGDLYPVEGVMNVVVTSSPKANDIQKNVHFVTGTPQDVVKYIENTGKKEALLIGGGTTNAHFLEAGLVDEIILSVHPMTVGQGIPLFKGNEIEKHFELVDVKKLEEGLVQLRYSAKS